MSTHNKARMFLAVCLAVMALTFVTPVTAKADIIDFEDLYTGQDSYGAMPAGYHGFTWGNADWITKNYALNTGYYFGTFGNVSIFKNGKGTNGKGTVLFYLQMERGRFYFICSFNLIDSIQVCKKSHFPT